MRSKKRARHEAPGADGVGGFEARLRSRLDEAERRLLERENELAHTSAQADSDAALVGSLTAELEERRVTEERARTELVAALEARDALSRALGEEEAAHAATRQSDYDERERISRSWEEASVAMRAKIDGLVQEKEMKVRRRAAHLGGGGGDDAGRQRRARAARRRGREGARRRARHRAARRRAARADEEALRRGLIGGDRGAPGGGGGTGNLGAGGARVARARETDGRAPY